MKCEGLDSESTKLMVGGGEVASCYHEASLSVSACLHVTELYHTVGRTVGHTVGHTVHRSYSTYVGRSYNPDSATCTYIGMYLS